VHKSADAGLSAGDIASIATAAIAVVALVYTARHLEALARDDGVPPSARVRAIEVLLRISKQQQLEDAECERIVRRFGPDRAE
jgi:hypothetical protein